MILLFVTIKCKLSISDVYMFCPAEKDKKVYAPFGVHSISMDQKNLWLVEAVLIERLGSVKRYLQAGTIFLAISDNFDKSMKDLEMGIFEKLEAISDSSILKFSSLISEQYPWELLIAQEVVSDKTILIGLYSIARVMPKLLFDVEPRVVFLDNLIRMPARETREQAMNETLSDYQNKDRVLTPKIFDELVLHLRALRNTEVQDETPI